MAMVREREGERWKRDERRRERESDGRGKDREGREKETDGSRGKDRDGREKETDGGGRGKERDGREKEKEKGNREKEGDGRGKDSRDGREKEGDGRGKDSRDGREKEADAHSGVKRKADTSRDHSREKQKRLGTHEEGNGEKIEVADKIIEEKTNGTTSVQQKQKEEAEVHSGVKRKADSLNIGGVSLDVLAKAKKTLQMQKELSEKLKRLPQLNKTGAPATTTTTTPPYSSTPGILTSGQATQSVPSQLNQSGVPTQGAVPPNLLGMMPGVPGIPGMPAGPGAANVGALANYEAIKRAHDLAMRLGFHQIPFGMPVIPNMVPTHLTDDMSGLGPKSVKAPVLRLDPQGREIDENGNVVERSKVTNVSTLKVNINKQKKEAFQILRPELEEDPVDNPFFDERVGLDKKKLVRARRPSFQFVEEGKWSKQAEMQKLRSQYGEAKAKEMKAKQAALSKAKVEADINPNLIEVSERVPIKEEKIKDPIPDIEWWDAIFLPSKNYRDVEEGKVKEEKIVYLVEHPVPIEPPAEPAPPPPQPLKLTKKEQKKLRTQRRLAKEKDRQEMIRQGLLEPPKSKVKMSNLMKVLGAEATQDPTKLEYEIRSAAAEREQAHTDRNLARKLTPAELREKKAKKLFDDSTTIETIVSVYRVLDLSHAPTRFKVDKNAEQNRLTGCAVMTDAMCVVIVEGGAKSIKRYNKLMTRRINWAAAVKEVTEEDIDEGPQRPNKCDLVWQGSVASQNFDKFILQRFRSAAAARKYLADANVGHYWDLVVNFNTEEN